MSAREKLDARAAELRAEKVRQQGDARQTAERRAADVAARQVADEQAVADLFAECNEFNGFKVEETGHEVRVTTDPACVYFQMSDEYRQYVTFLADHYEPPIMRLVFAQVGVKDGRYTLYTIDGATDYGSDRERAKSGLVEVLASIDRAVIRKSVLAPRRYR